MTIFCYILSGLLLVAGLGTCTMSKTAVHEIEGILLLLIAAIFFVGAALLDQLKKAKL
jgi:hypothetical protein